MKGQGDSSNLFEQRLKKYQVGVAVTYGVAIVALNKLWYADYQRSKFRFFNDNRQWLQMDKIGHVYSTYSLSRLNFDLIKTAHLNEHERKKAIYYSSVASALFLTSIEILDGFSSEWGFSWGDFAANSAGIILFSAQELAFKKQMVRMKYSYQSSSYQSRRPSVFGENTLQGAFKDYNGQTYWLSTTISDWTSVPKLKWLGISVGYGANQMLSAVGKNFENFTTDPYREYYLGLDVDLEKIKTNKNWLRKTFKVLNHIKVPAPTFEINQNGGRKFHWLYF